MIRRPSLGILKKNAEVFASVEIIRQSENHNLYNFLLIKRENTKVVVLDKKLGLDNVDLFSDVVRKKIPFVLSLSGAGVLYKKGRFEENKITSGEDILRHLLPNVEPQDFLFEIHKSKTGTVFCTLVRKTVVEEIVKEWIARGAFILDVGIGIFTVSEILPLLSNNISRLNIQDYKLIIHDNGLYDYARLKTRPSNTYFIGGEELSGNLLPAFANAFRYFILKSKVCSWNTISEQRNEYHHFKKSTWLLKVIIATMIFILIGSFSTRFFLSRKLKQTETKLATSKQVLAAYQQLAEKYNQKKAIMKAQGINNENYISVLLDRIARDVPGSVYLTALRYDPRLKRVKNNRLFAEDEIVISGYASDVKELYRWINDIDKLDRVSGVKLSNYNFIKDKGQANFEIEITLAN